MIRQNINYFMSEAMSMARFAFENDEVPVGAIIVNNGEIIGRGFNQVIKKKLSFCSCRNQCN
jgi:tRNA(adenine34) deaminase